MTIKEKATEAFNEFAELAIEFASLAGALLLFFALMWVITFFVH